MSLCFVNDRARVIFVVATAEKESAYIYVLIEIDVCLFSFCF